MAMVKNATTAARLRRNSRQASDKGVDRNDSSVLFSETGFAFCATAMFSLLNR
jgi:hypothetical protein